MAIMRLHASSVTAVEEDPAMAAVVEIIDVLNVVPT